MNRLPPEYLSRMRELLGSEYSSYEASCWNSAFRGIRLNPLKCDEETLRVSLPFPVRPTPFSPLGFYLPDGAEKLGRLPMHHAGAFYVQEPSASGAVTVLDPKPGEKILDLCAAPGGKSTQIASLLGGEGLLWSNEVVRSRTGALLSNLERMGARNTVVSSCYPETLCRALEGFFDRVLVDAPCSGEGMFRRSEEAVHDWSPEHVASCAVRQRAILESACLALKENGVLVYSTCTFSREENEDVISHFLSEHPEFCLEDCGVPFGRPAFLPEARRIFPMDGGEGHFMAKMRRIFGGFHSSARAVVGTKAPEEARELWRQIFRTEPPDSLVREGDNYYLVSPCCPQTEGLGLLRRGLLLGSARPGRTEPAHAAFLSARPDELQNVVSFSHDSPEIMAFLHGEELAVPASLKGWCGVAVNGVTVGFGKCSGGRLKNRYPKGLRNL